MALPTFENVMLPMLELLRDGSTRRFSEIVPAISDALELSKEEREHLIPSRRMTTIRSRTYWAAFYLDKARVLTKPGRGQLQITQRGKDVLSEAPPQIDIDFLMRFPEFQQFREKSGTKSDNVVGIESDALIGAAKLSPEETLESSYQTLRLQLADELLERLKNGSPAFFEQVVVDLLVAMGYGGSHGGVAQAIGKSGDGGIDGVINEDKLGLDVVYIQAKRWQGTVGRPEVQKFAGSLIGVNASKGVFLTTGTFSQDARQYAQLINQRIVLIDGDTLAGYMIDHDVGVSSSATYVVKRIDTDYFEEA